MGTIIVEDEEVEIVAQGVGEPRYLILDPDGPPWVGNLDDLLNGVRAIDQASVWLITRERQAVPVEVESTDGYPDHLDWEVTLPSQGGELVERLEYNPDMPDNFLAANRTIQVNGFN